MEYFLIIAVFLSISLVMISMQSAQGQGFTPPIGNWRIIADGHQGSLDITSTDSGFHHPRSPSGVSQSGKDIIGTIKLNDEARHNITGFYNDNLHRIIFVRVVNSSNLSQDQIFTGYLLTGSLNNVTNLKDSCSSIGGFENTHTLTGQFEMLSGPQALADNNVRGWYAESSYCQLP
jgi:hypothetical protein